MPKATKEEAMGDIKHGDWEEDSCVRPHKSRNCVFCEKNIPANTSFIKNFPYPYETQKNWVADESCFQNVLKETEGFTPSAQFMKEQYLKNIQFWMKNGSGVSPEPEKKSEVTEAYEDALAQAAHEDQMRSIEEDARAQAAHEDQMRSIEEDSHFGEGLEG